MIKLGCCDVGTTDQAQSDYLAELERLTRVPIDQVASGADKLQLTPYAPPHGATRGVGQNVMQLQQALVQTAFFPGGKADGICGYRTLSAIRLFQEYVRSVEKLACTPDGLFGPQSQRHLDRWTSDGLEADWQASFSAWQARQSAAPEYEQWLTLLRRYRDKAISDPTPVQSLVNDFKGPSDTNKAADLDFSPQHIHLIGIRRRVFSGKFDDAFILLIKGLVFKFQGSTEPGYSEDKRGTPFLVNGQHDYHFGWHQLRYLALRPRHFSHGVLVVRSRDNKRLDAADLNNGLEANASINIHWGGKGGQFNVATWSAGCQVINGLYYTNHQDAMVDCSSFVATNNKAVNNNSSLTRGAYNVLLDLITALSGDMRSNTVKYTLLDENDLSHDANLRSKIAQAHDDVMGKLT